MDKNSKILLYNLLKEYEREKKNDTIKKLLDEIPHVEFDSAHSS
jgi:hemerythrin superfamily protein